VTPSPTAGDALERVADVVQSVAVLISAGIPPHAVWAYVAESLPQIRDDRVSRRAIFRARVQEDSEEAAVLVVVRGIAAAEGNTADVIASSASRAPEGVGAAWRALACVWRVAERSGAPVADCLCALADSLRSMAATEREIDVAMAGPQSTVRLISVLPLVSIALGWCLGFDALTVLVTTNLGMVFAALGVALWCIGVGWSRLLIARARAVRPLVGFELDLVAVAAVGEADHRAACAVAHEALSRFGFTVDRGPHDSRDVFDLARRAGIPAHSLLQARAEQGRRRNRHRSRREIAKLEVSLVLPLGLCIMPAFIALGIAPVVLSVFFSTVAELAG